MHAAHADVSVGRALHPDTGLHYTHLVPTGAYDDARRALNALMMQQAFVTAASPEQYRRLVEQATERDMLIIWGWGIGPWGSTHAPPKRAQRRCRVALHYGETVGHPALLTAPQRKMLENMLSVVDHYDAVFVHTPSAAAWFAERGIAAHLAPLGYSFAAFGAPDWLAQKRFDVVHYGARLGRRLGLPKIVRKLDAKYKNIVAYGDARQALLNASRSILQFHHCDASCSFASFRLWQALGSSAALMMEPCDAWPAIGGRHYIELPHYATPGSESAKVFARAIDTALEQDVLAVARTAHDELKAYTPRRMMEEFIVPVSATF